MLSANLIMFPIFSGLMICHAAITGLQDSSGYFWSLKKAIEFVSIIRGMQLPLLLNQFLNFFDRTG